MFFFFKQKTAYEMRISDWSSDVGSSDLVFAALGAHVAAPGYEITRHDLEQTVDRLGIEVRRDDVVLIRTGWGRRWDDHDAFLDWQGGLPGPGTEAIERLVGFAPKVVGSDTIAFENLAPGKGLSELPEIGRAQV